MNKLSIFSLVTLLGIFAACQKQQTEADRNAEVERQVNERLAAERQAQEQQRLAQRQDELDARLKALGQQQQTAPAETAAPERATERAETEREEGTSYSMFYNKLEPYGSWLETSDYGYVWQPRYANESRSWRPYTNGHWVYTDAGWTWISEEPFGWATYHYGRWARLRGVGWVWVPGDEWAPAWVSWRTSNDYVGWAPLPPEAQFERRTGIHNWADNYYDIGPEHYCFVPTREIGTERIERVVVPAEQNVTIVNQTTNVTNITYNNTVVINQGPNYDELRARSQQPIQRLRLERRTNVNIATENPRPIVRGEVVELPAPVVTRARPVDRPPPVKQKITTTVVERGWENVGNTQAAQQARARIKAEATPPPNAPPKRLPTPVRGAAQGRPVAPAATSATPFARSTSAPAPARAVSSPAPSPPTARVTRPGAATTTPLQTAAASPVHTPAAARAARPAATATVTPLHTATPPAAASPRLSAARTPIEAAAPTAPPAFSPRSLPTKSPPLPAPSASPTSTVAMPPGLDRAAAKEQRKAEKQLRKQEREQRKAQRFEAAAPMPAATATPVSSAPAALSPPPPGKARGKDKRAPQGAPSATATPTASPAS